MCVIVDTNCLAPVFDKNSEDHEEFKPVLDWILKGKGKLIYGGSKYIAELKKSTKFAKIINIFKKEGKAVVVDKDLVDKEQERIEQLITDKDFDDPQLPAIVIVSHCKIICSKDTRSIKFVTDPMIYPKGIETPKYYTSSRNTNLLCDNYIDSRYKPLNKCNKAVQTKIEGFLD